MDEVCKETKLKSSNSYTVNVVGFRVQNSNCIVVVGLLICSPKHLLRENLLLGHVGFNNELLGLSRLWECKHGFKNQTGLADPTGSTGKRPLIWSDYG